MIEDIAINQSRALSGQEFRTSVVDLENQLLNSDDPMVVKGNSDSFPLTHSFSEGIYVREMKMDKGGMVIGKIHNRTHTWFLMKGYIIVATEEGVMEYIAPTYVNAAAGAKRVIEALEDSVFINVHPNPDNITDTDELEKILTCDSYEAYTEYKQIKQ
jgi:quercetin dioxygenase-like cupin family protein